MTPRSSAWHLKTNWPPPGATPSSVALPGTPHCASRGRAIRGFERDHVVRGRFLRRKRNRKCGFSIPKFVKILARGSAAQLGRLGRGEDLLGDFTRFVGIEVHWYLDGLGGHEQSDHPLVGRPDLQVCVDVALVVDAHGTLRKKHIGPIASGD